MTPAIARVLFGIVLGLAAGLAASVSVADDAPAHVGSAVCGGCHAEAAAAWAGSDHAHAWTLPSPETVLGDFDNARLDDDGRVSRFFTEDGAYFIETDDAQGRRQAFRVVGVVGIDPLQQYLISPGPGRTQVYDVAWDTEAGRWFPVFPDQNAVPGDGYHWTGPYKNWEARCATCHATGYARHYDPAARRYHPQMSEQGVGCEACHGPGAAHVAWAEDGAAPGADLGPTGLTVALGPGTASELPVCLTCHSLREQLTDAPYLPGHDFHDDFTLLPLESGQFEPDGTILSESFEGGAFLQSKMHAMGVTCSNCHEPHGSILRAEGNAVCTQCHSPAGNPAFPSLPLKVFDGPEHHFHAEGSPGAACVACHMPQRTYMGVDERRDHGFRIPRPDLASTGAPDACTDCHTDRDAGWAAAEIAARYPDSTHRGPHFAETFAAARTDPQAQADALIGIAEWPGPAIIRASALALLPFDLDPYQTGRVAALLADPDPTIRAAATRPLRAWPPEERLRALAPVLADPVRSVRVAAAQSVADLVAAFPQAPGLAQATADWQVAVDANRDFPEANLRRGGTALTARDLPTAVQAFSEAVRQDPQLVPAWAMLAQIYAAIGDPGTARAILSEALARNPGDASLLALQSQL